MYSHRCHLCSVFDRSIQTIVDELESHLDGLGSAGRLSMASGSDTEEPPADTSTPQRQRGLLLLPHSLTEMTDSYSEPDDPFSPRLDRPL